MRYHPRKAPANRFASAARKELGEALFDELAVFNYELYRMLLRQKIAHSHDRDASSRRTRARVFLVWAPLHRDLDKLLHQAGGEKNFLPALERLARVVVEDVAGRVNYPTRSFQNVPEVGALPLSGATLSHLVFERFAATSKTWLPAALASHQAWAVAALKNLKGQSLSEMAQLYLEAAKAMWTQQQHRIDQLLARTYDVLGAEDFAYLQAHLDIGALKRFTR